jgi:uncharacterized protein YdhG (YjbR/CyaY superfamily)
MVTRLPKPKSVEEYLERLPEPARTSLEKVRAALLAAAPSDATEGIGYQMPGIRCNGRFVFYYAAFKSHCSLFPASGSVIEKFKDELKNYEVDKGTIRFPVDKAPPATLIRKLLKARLAE